MNTPIAWFEGFKPAMHAVNGQQIFARQGGAEGQAALLLLHGFPQTHALWHRVVQRLAAHYRIVVADLRGYGQSGKPDSDATHAPYSKRAMAADMVALMRSLGHERFFLCGHDRGGRVSHRLALDHPQAVRKLMLLDIAPTLDMYERTDMRFATLYYHWFHLIQPAPYPEQQIGLDPIAYLHGKLKAWGRKGDAHFEPLAMAEYERCISQPQTIHAMCEDYRAAASIDLEHDRESREAGLKIACPTQVLWGEFGVIQKLFKPLELWQAQCDEQVTGHTLPCGHYLPEEQSQATAAALLDFMR
jgi:haloacetate dehalogenase